jgi:hypothetical protein
MRKIKASGVGKHMDLGWIKLHRKILSHRFWQRKPFSPGQAMIDLLLRATHKPYEKAVGLQSVHLEPGEFFTSIRNLVNDWMWSKKKVCNFLDALEDEKFLERNGNEKGTTFRIVNWHSYQDSGDTKGTQGGHLQEYKNMYRGKYFSVTESQHQKYEEAYPGLDLLGEYKKMDAWLESNPTKRKTPRGYPRFVNNWLAGACKDQQVREDQGTWFEKYPMLT